MRQIKISKKVWDNFTEREKSHAKFLFPIHGISDTKRFFKAAKEKFGPYYKIYGRKLAVDAPGAFFYEWSFDNKKWYKIRKKPVKGAKNIWF